MRSTVLATCMTLGLALSPRVGDACGGCFIAASTTGNKTVQVVTDHRMVLALSAQQTTLWDQIRYAGEPGAFVWVLPIPRGVPVRMGLGDNAFVDAVAEVSAPRITGDFDIVCGFNGVAQARPRRAADAGTRGSFNPTTPSTFGGGGGGGGGGFGCGGSATTASLDYAPGSAGSGNGGSAGDGMPYTGTENLSVVGARDTVGPYATEVVRGGAGAFQRWAAEHRYDIPRETVRAVEWYESLGTDFLVLQLAPEAGVDQMQPVRITFPGYVPTLPLRMIAAGVADKVGLDLMVIANGPMQVEGFATEFILPSQLEWDIGNQRSNYRALFNGILARNRGRVWVTESTMTLEGPTMSFAGSEGPARSGLDGGVIEVFTGVSDAGAEFINTDRLLQPGRVPMENTRADPYVDRRIAFAHLGTRATLTRLRTELDRNALDQDLRLGPAPDFLNIPRDRVALRATNVPPCNALDAGAPFGGATFTWDAGAPSASSPPTARNGILSCTISHRRGAGPALLLAALGALLRRRALRRRVAAR